MRVNIGYKIEGKTFAMFSTVNNNYYFGQFNNNKPDGFIRHFNKDTKLIYKCAMTADYKYNDHGVLCLNNGDVHIGNFINEIIEGKGTKYFIINFSSWTGYCSNGYLNWNEYCFNSVGEFAENILYEYNVIKTRSNLRIIDYTSPGIERSFDDAIKRKYKGVMERLLRLGFNREELKLRNA